MALPTVTDVKRYLRIEHTAEDSMLTRELAAALAMVETYIRRPVVAEARTFVLPQPTQRAYRDVGSFFLPVYPVAATPLITLTDDDGTLLTHATDYRVELETGQIIGLVSAFALWPYTVVATVGLSARADYATRVEPAIGAAILDIVSDRWHRRSPAATNESTGGGVSTSYANGLPERVKAILQPFVMARAL